MFTELQRFALQFDTCMNFQLDIITVRREDNVFTRVCPSIHPSIRLSMGGGVPQPGPAGGVPWPGPEGLYPPGPGTGQQME